MRGSEPTTSPRPLCGDGEWRRTRTGGRATRRPGAASSGACRTRPVSGPAHAQQARAPRLSTDAPPAARATVPSTGSPPRPACVPADVHQVNSMVRCSGSSASEQPAPTCRSQAPLEDFAPSPAHATTEMTPSLWRRAHDGQAWGSCKMLAAVCRQANCSAHPQLTTTASPCEPCISLLEPAAPACASLTAGRALAARADPVAAAQAAQADLAAALRAERRAAADATAEAGRARADAAIAAAHAARHQQVPPCDGGRACHLPACCAKCHPRW